MSKKSSRETKPMSRPSKMGCDRRRRIAQHRKRLAAFGIPESVTIHMTPDLLRKALQEQTRKAARAARAARRAGA